MVRCVTLYCLNDAEPGRTVCGKCRSRAFRARHPVKAAYTALRTNAKRRGIYFGISFVEWERFCTETGYIELKGTGATDMTIDRKDPRMGYIYSNMQLLTNTANVKKRDKDRQGGWETVISLDPSCPF